MHPFCFYGQTHYSLRKSELGSGGADGLCMWSDVCVCVGGLHTYISSNGTKALMKMISGVKATDWRGERRDS